MTAPDADGCPDRSRHRPADVVTLVTGPAGRTATSAPDLDELLAVRRATDLRFTEARRGGAVARADAVVVLALGAALALGLFGGGDAGRLGWILMAMGILVLARWATRRIGARSHAGAARAQGPGRTRGTGRVQARPGAVGTGAPTV
jgi:hypothetical protein